MLGKQLTKFHYDPIYDYTAVKLNSENPKWLPGGHLEFVKITKWCVTPPDKGLKRCQI